MVDPGCGLHTLVHEIRSAHGVTGLNRTMRPPNHDSVQLPAEQPQPCSTSFMSLSEQTSNVLSAEKVKTHLTVLTLRRSFLCLTLGSPGALSPCPPAPSSVVCHPLVTSKSLPAYSDLAKFRHFILLLLLPLNYFATYAFGICFKWAQACKHQPKKCLLLAKDHGMRAGKRVGDFTRLWEASCLAGAE